METDTQKEVLLGRILGTLQDYLDAVPRQQLPNPPDLLVLFERLDALEAELTPAYSPELRHYMHQKSYRKAYLFLKGQDSENVNGSCRR
jgi:hypothetical protein